MRTNNNVGLIGSPILIGAVTCLIT
ncbi:MAG: hypothetical protein QOC95_2592, partial [Thermoleophilaceae bacterium]|nr:hypothetical protein [Thermoleophilaceae bacterium]